MYSLYMWVELSGPLTGRHFIFVPGWAACRAGVTSQARARLVGRASPGTVASGTCRAWVGPKLRAFAPGHGLNAHL
jgi:hypothetical protein